VYIQKSFSVFERSKFWFLLLERFSWPGKLLRLKEFEPSAIFFEWLS